MKLHEFVELPDFFVGMADVGWNVVDRSWMVFIDDDIERFG